MPNIVKFQTFAQKKNDKNRFLIQALNVVVMMKKLALKYKE